MPYGRARNLGDWLLDLNSRDDGLESPLYFQLENSEEMARRWWLLESAPGLEESHELFTRIQGAHQQVADGADAAELSALWDRMKQCYPRVCDTFRDWFAQFGIEESGSAHFEDNDGKRLIEAYQRMLPIARVLIARCAGDRHARLSVEDFDDAMAFDHRQGGDYPPAMMLRLLASVLSQTDTAKHFAQVILEETRGVPLTRRWAELVASDSGPFAP